MVYKAQDTRVDRFVALKFLPDDVAKDPQALSRFRREAKAVSALNHPNICTIYDVGEDKAQALIAMGYLEGTTLRHRIGSRPLELETLLRYQHASDLHAELQRLRRDSNSGRSRVLPSGDGTGRRKITPERGLMPWQCRPTATGLLRALRAPTKNIWLPPRRLRWMEAPR